MEDYVSLLNTCLDFNHVLVKALIFMRSTGHKKVTAERLLRYQFGDNSVRSAYIEQLDKHLVSRGAWNDIQVTVNTYDDINLQLSSKD